MWFSSDFVILLLGHLFSCFLSFSRSKRGISKFLWRHNLKSEDTKQIFLFEKKNQNYTHQTDSLLGFHVPFRWGVRFNDGETTIAAAALNTGENGKSYIDLKKCWFSWNFINLSFYADRKIYKMFEFYNGRLKTNI